MAEFAYIARDLTGQRITGRLEAATHHEALAVLDQRALFPISVEAEKTATRRGRRVRAQLVATTFGQLSDLLRSGVPLLRSIAVIRDQATHAGLKYVLSDLHDQVSEGRTLSEAYYRALLFTGKVVMLTGFTLAAGVATWVASPIKFQADMGLLLAFMFLWNMLGALVLLPALAHFLLRPAPASLAPHDAPAPASSLPLAKESA